jgi:hypothetical protein
LLKLFINPYIKNFIFNETWKLIQPKEEEYDDELPLLDENFKYWSSDEDN